MTSCIILLIKFRKVLVQVSRGVKLLSSEVLNFTTNNISQIEEEANFNFRKREKEKNKRVETNLKEQATRHV